MAVQRWLRIVATTCWCPVACSFDTSGLGALEVDTQTLDGGETWSMPSQEDEGGGAPSGGADDPSGPPSRSSSDTNGSSGPDSADGDDGPTTTTTTTTTNEDDPTESEDTGSTSTGDDVTGQEVDPCAGPPPFTAVIMFTVANSDLVETNDIIYSGTNGFDGNDDDDLALFGGEEVFGGRNVNDGGSARFRVDFDLACPTEVFVWGLVYDESITQTNVDFFDWELEGDAGRWDFGCEGNNVGWQWERVHALGQECSFDAFAPSLEAGSYRIEFTDGEGDPAGNPGGPPRMAGIVVTNDPALDPEQSIYPVE